MSPRDGAEPGNRPRPNAGLTPPRMAELRDRIERIGEPCGVESRRGPPLRLPASARKSFEELRAEHGVVPLSQGDLLDDCPLVFWVEQTREVADGDKPQSLQARVIVLTQTCDLANGKTARVVVAAVHLVQEGRVKEKVIRDHVRKGQVYGWYFLPADLTRSGFPESLVDLRDLHTVPMALLEGLQARGKHVGRLVTPYREHLAQHFSVTYSRIGLPEPYGTLE